MSRPILPIYVVESGALLKQTIAAGSAVVAIEGAGGCWLYYEGNLLGAENLSSFEERAKSAAGRAVERYPTVARLWQPSVDGLRQVGTVDTATWRVSIADREAVGNAQAVYARRPGAIPNDEIQAAFSYGRVAPDVDATEAKALMAYLAARAGYQSIADLPDRWLGVISHYIADSPGYTGEVYVVVWGGGPGCVTVVTRSAEGGFRVATETGA